MQSTRTHYQVLGVSPDAPLADIKAAWKKIAHECHPDRVKDAFLNNRYYEANEAYAILGHYIARTKYDVELEFKANCDTCSGKKVVSRTVGFSHTKLVPCPECT